MRLPQSQNTKALLRNDKKNTMKSKVKYEIAARHASGSRLRVVSRPRDDRINTMTPASDRSLRGGKAFSADVAISTQSRRYEAPPRSSTQKTLKPGLLRLRLAMTKKTRIGWCWSLTFGESIKRTSYLYFSTMLIFASA